MYVSARAQHGLRVLIVLARATGPAATAELADACDLPATHLQAVLTELRRKRIIAAPTRGTYCLAEPPTSITIAAAMRALASPFIDVSAAPTPWTLTPRLDELWGAVDGAIEGVLSLVTLADLVAAEDQPAGENDTRSAV